MLGRPLQGIGLASVGAAQGPVPLLRRQGTARLELELGSQPFGGPASHRGGRTPIQGMPLLALPWGCLCPHKPMAS